MILFFSLCVVMPAKAQSATGAMLKTKAKEAREKVKEVTQSKADKKSTAPAKTGTSASRKWGATTVAATTGKNETKGQVVIPVRPAPPVESRRYVDTAQNNPW